MIDADLGDVLVDQARAFAESKKVVQSAHAGEEEKPEELLYIPSGAAASEAGGVGTSDTPSGSETVNAYVRPEGLKRTTAKARAGLGISSGAEGKTTGEAVKKWRTVARVAGIAAALRKSGPQQDQDQAGSPPPPPPPPRRP